MVSRPQHVTSHTKEIPHESVYRQKTLRVRGRLKPLHLSLALAGPLVRHLRSIVLVLPRAVNNRRHDRAVRRRVAAQLVRNQLVRCATLFLQ